LTRLHVKGGQRLLNKAGGGGLPLWKRRTRERRKSVAKLWAIAKVLLPTEWIGRRISAGTSRIEAVATTSRSRACVARAGPRGGLPLSARVCLPWRLWECIRECIVVGEVLVEARLFLS
jgi:hypothetical protein